MAYEPTALDKAIDTVFTSLRKQLVLVGKVRIASFLTWFILGFAVGVISIMFYAASQGGGLADSLAARNTFSSPSAQGVFGGSRSFFSPPAQQQANQVQQQNAVVNNNPPPAAASARQGIFGRVLSLLFGSRQSPPPAPAPAAASAPAAPSACDTAAVARKTNDAAQAYLQNNLGGAASAIRQAQALLAPCQTSCDTSAIINNVNAAGATYLNNVNGAIEKLRSAGTQLAVCQERASSASCSPSVVGQKFADAGSAMSAPNGSVVVAQNLNGAADILSACRVSSSSTSSSAAGSGSPPPSASSSGSDEFGPVSYSGRFMVIAMPLQDSAFEPRSLTSTFCGNGVNESQNGCKDSVELTDPGVQPGDKLEAWWIAHNDEFEACNVWRPGEGEYGKLNKNNPIPFIGSIVGNAMALTSLTYTGKLGTNTQPTVVAAGIHCGTILSTPQGDIIVPKGNYAYYTYETFGSGKVTLLGSITQAAISPLFPHASHPLAATGSFPKKEGRDIILTINGFKVKGDPGRPTYVSVEGASATATWQAPPEYTSCAINAPGQIVGLMTTPNWLRLPTSGSREIALRDPNPAQVGLRGITPNPTARVMIMCAGPDYLPVVKAAMVVGE